MEENKKVIDAAQAPGGPSKATTSAEIRRKMDDLAFKIGVWSNGIDYFLENDAPQAVVDKYVQGMETLAINKIAEALRLTDEEKARLSDPETRTQKQKEAIFDTMRRIYGQLYLKYAESNFIHSFNIVVNVATEALGVSLELDNPETEPMLQALNMLNSYFYIEAHQGIDPLGNGDIGEAEETELRDLTKSYLKFHQAQDKEPTESVMGFISSTIGEDNRLIVESVRLEDFIFPIDKVNKTIWRLLEKHSAGDQIGIHMESRASKDPVLLYYAISFDELENQGITITKRLTAYEKRVYVAAGALYAIKGQMPFTYTELYYAMGYTGKPGGNDLDKLAAAVTKMGGARIFVDNSQEIAAKYDYPRFRYDGYLFPMERVTAIVDGKVTDAAIHLFREPPLITFARQREQITQINIKLLQSPASKTEANIALEDYLIERIAQARNERHKLEKKRCKTDEERRKKAEALRKDPRILFATLYEHAEIKTKMQRQRAPEKVKRILEHYKGCNFIRDYKIDDTGITITL